MKRINFIKDFKVFNVAAKNDDFRPAFNKVFFPKRLCVCI